MGGPSSWLLRECVREGENAFLAVGAWRWVSAQWCVLATSFPFHWPLRKWPEPTLDPLHRPLIFMLRKLGSAPGASCHFSFECPLNTMAQQIVRGRAGRGMAGWFCSSYLTLCLPTVYSKVEKNSSECSVFDLFLQGQGNLPMFDWRQNLNVWTPLRTPLETPPLPLSFSDSWPPEYPELNMGQHVQAEGPRYLLHRSTVLGFIRQSYRPAMTAEALVNLRELAIDSERMAFEGRLK